MKKIATIIFGMLLSTSAFAQVPGGVIVQNGKHVSINAPDAATGSLAIVVPNGTPSFEVWTGGTKRTEWTGAGEEKRASTTKVVNVPYVPTMAATPNATANVFQGYINVIPTNAANNAGLLPASPTAGTVKIVINASGANQRVKAGGTDTMTAGGTTGAAGTYTLLANGEQGTCVANSTSNWVCTKESAAPTPAGP